MRQRNAQAIDLSGYMIWATANQRSNYYIPFGDGASVASGETYTMCNARIGYGAGSLGRCFGLGLRPGSPVPFHALATLAGHDLRCVPLAFVC